MPRIEIVPEDWNQSKEKARGDGTPTVDVCTGCAVLFHEGGQTIDDIEVQGTVGSTDVEHPPYEDTDYDCAVCGKALTERDN